MIDPTCTCERDENGDLVSFDRHCPAAKARSMEGEQERLLGPDRGE